MNTEQFSTDPEEQKPEDKKSSSEFGGRPAGGEERRAAERGASEPSSGTEAGPHEESEGTGSSVTPGALVTDGESAGTKLLLLSVDSLDLGVYASWPEEVWHTLTEDFDRYRLSAVNTSGVLFPYILNSLMLPSGKAPLYRWQIRTPEMILYFSRSGRVGHAPNVYVSLLSEALQRLGVEELVQQVRSRICDDLLGNAESIKVSRADLAADFRIPTKPHYAELVPLIVPSDRKGQIHHHNQNLETLYVGAKSSPIQLRIYDKGMEIRNSSFKFWFKELWGVESVDGVWRVEFQLRRGALREFGIHSVEDLIERRAGLWKYLTEEWISLRLLDDSNTTRRTIHPLWKAVQNAGMRWGESDRAIRIKSPPAMDLDAKLAVLFGHLVGLGAISGHLSIRDALDLMWSGLQKHPKVDEFEELVRIKMIRLGLTPPSGRGGQCS